MEKSISLLSDFIGQNMCVVAYGDTYTGTLVKVDYDKEFIMLLKGKDKIEIDLERVESFTIV
ncbi:hypothetical protein K1X76_00935 [bacterium]|nr:hypothetical protein [bacterium]